MTKLIFEKSVLGRQGFNVPQPAGSALTLKHQLPRVLFREQLPALPEVGEIEVVRHYTHLSTLNYGVDTGAYPLGSCTMKYNPKISEDIAAWPSLQNLHPLAGNDSLQGLLACLMDLEQSLCEIFGYYRFSLQPAAGAHGEYTGLMIIRAFHQFNHDTKRTVILVPDTAHGTNPASAAMAGFSVKTIPSDAHGNVDLEFLKAALNDQIAGLMLTNPSTVGLFEPNIELISALVHDAGGLMYYDGANSNALLGLVKPGEMGFDVAHINLHKTFATPHGGGGPGSGPIGVVEKLVPFLPVPVIENEKGRYLLRWNKSESIGKVATFYGQVSVLMKAYIYILRLGSNGLKAVAHHAILNANYMRQQLKSVFEVPFDSLCMHEFVISAKKEKAHQGVKAVDIAKRLIDYGFHPPTIYFPLIVAECLMIEPTETESKESMDCFIDAMKKIAKEIQDDPALLHNAPHHTPVKRLDETKAVKEPILIFTQR